jgi:hypothetical protein
MAEKDRKHQVQSMNKQHHASKSPELVPVHLSKDEVIGFNILQADQENPNGQYVDPKTGLREYSRLSHLLRLTHIKEAFIQLAQSAKTGEGLTEDIAKQMETPLPQDLFIPIPSDDEPAVDKMEEAATTPDDEFIVMMPVDVVHFLSKLQGGGHNDPTFDLPQFGFFSSIGNIVKSTVRVVATVAGTVAGFAVGGPMGAAAGAYAGNALGRGVTGQSFFGSNNALKAAIPNAFYGAAAGSGMSAMGVGQGAAAVGAPIINGTTGAAMPGLATTGAAATTAPAAMSMTAGMGNYLVPAGLMGAGYLLGNKGDKQREKKEDAYAESHKKSLEESQKAYNAQGLSSQLYGYAEPAYNEHYGRAKTKNPYQTLDSFTKEWETKGYNPHRRYKKGGLVKDYSTKGVPLIGKGKGQEDLILDKLPEKTWVHDAHTVSALGDGTTKEGHKDIREFEKFIKKELLPLHKDKLMEQIKSQPGGKLRQVNVAVANGEDTTPPLLVGALGEGCFEKGAERLRKVTKEIRRHKVSNHDELPPASHGLMTYYKKVIGR